MERDRQPRLRPVERVLRVGRQVFEHMSRPPETPAPWRPSAQRDVGKSAVRASEVSLVIQGMQSQNMPASLREEP